MSKTAWVEDSHGDRWAWPETEDEIAACREMVRRGEATEHTGVCDGCEDHAPGTEVPTFRAIGREGF